MGEFWLLVRVLNKSIFLVRLLGLKKNFIGVSVSVITLTKKKKKNPPFMENLNKPK